MEDPDGFSLLTSARVEPLLATAVKHAGGLLVSWQLDQIDQNPGQSSVVTYQAVVDWSYGRREEVLGVSCRANGLSETDALGDVFADGDCQVAFWIYPRDPDLPGLARAAYAESMAELCNLYRVFPGDVRPEQLLLRMVGYRPRRRAVLKVTHRDTGVSVYVKVLREKYAAEIVRRHELLAVAGLPVAEIKAVTPDHLLVLSELAGKSLAEAIFAAQPPCSAEEILSVLDRLPPAVAKLPRRPPWAESLPHYAAIIRESMPALGARLDGLVSAIQEGLADTELGDEPSHGDFHEGQLQVRDGRIVGLLDVDTAGPGRRVDDLACLVAHLSTIQHMNSVQTERAHRVIREWVPVFDTQVDPGELRLRAAAVIISLATGPFRNQEADWQRETVLMVGSAEALVRQVLG
ncbi:MAG: aminoglycoside phosphotransferase family protein [Propionibacteriaceae bacterium]|jgi:hypothetical protein|nr:aminoglycoside phosphotransferase family protein [Propionibacteriaceae bacterium]